MRGSTYSRADLGHRLDAMQHATSAPSTWASRFLAWIRPTRVYLTEDGASVLAKRIATQFEDELETKKLKAVQA